MISQPTPVTIIILTWNGLQYTQRCLETLIANTRHPDYRIVVVDNGSTDGSPEYLAQQSSLTLIRNAANLGFAQANNIGIRSTDESRDIVLLNNDVEVHQPDWLTNLQGSAYQAADIGIVGCRLSRPDGRLQHAGAYMPLETFRGQQIGGGEKDVNQYNEDRDVESVVFACVYLKRATLKSVGLLDESYFCYFEDTDYCYRASTQGYRTVCCGSVTMLHHENASTRVNSVRHSSYFDKGRNVFRSKWAAELERTRYTRELGWNSVLNLPSAYALSSREFVAALDSQRVRVSYQYAYRQGTTIPPREPEQSDSPLIDNIRNRKLSSNLVQVVYSLGDVFQANFGAYKIGYTMLETDRIPSEWVKQANRMDEVWVPSRFNVETFQDSGVSKPIHVIPLGVDPDHFNPRIAAEPLSGIYTFLSVFEWGERKAPEILLRAFNQEFRSDEPVILLVKVTNKDPGVDVARDVANLNLDPAGGRIHLSLNQLVPTHQLGVLYRSADCFVLPTRGEGWGMPVIEAMACGLPVIVTDWSAHCDFVKPENAYPLAVERLVPADAKCPYYAGFHWAEPSYTDLRRLMRHVFENQEEARSKGQRASDEVRAHWTWNQAATRMIARLDCIGARSTPKP